MDTHRAVARRWRGLLLAALLGSLSCALGKQPNVVLILADDLGWTGLGCYGSDLHETPRIDGLAAKGVRFTEAYAASPVCTPTRASIQTGIHPARLHMTIWRESAKNQNEKRPMLEPVCEEDLPVEPLTVAELLKGAGYLTAHIGKWHLGSAKSFPEAHGYDISVGGNIWGAPDSFWHPYRGAERFAREGFRYVPGLNYSRDGDYLTDKLTDEALRVIEFAEGKPFFLNLCYYSVHTPIEAKEEDAAYFEGKIGKETLHRNAHYAAMHRSLDENVGRILDKLENRGLSENTIVMFLSDNGGFEGKYQGETVTNNLPLRSGKGSLYEGGLRIPLIVSGPGIKLGGRSCDAPVITTDLLPTIAELTGLRKELQEGASRIDGESFSGFLNDPARLAVARELYFHYPHYYHNTSPVSAMRSGRWKLLRYYEDGRLELFDLKGDPGEEANLLEARQEIAGKMGAKLASWLDETSAQLPSENPAAKAD